jgi:hypothetical protein
MDSEPTTQTKADASEALAGLERFVAENDELLELEERIGRFNIFDALRIVEREVKHSDFLAWLLDPNESHGQGGLFLRAILMDLFKTARENGFTCPVSPIELDGEELRGIEVRREWRHIDLLIRCDQPRFILGIENKIRSGEHGNQLKRYRESVETEFGNVSCMYVYLTVEGDEPSGDQWVPYSYADLHRVLVRARNANETSIGDDVLAFLDHYLRLIRGRLMDDPKIAELCQRIYKNHRQALQLIHEHTGTGTSRILSIAEDLLREDSRWRVVGRTTQRLRFVPKEWFELLPPIVKESIGDKRLWINVVFRTKANSLISYLSVRPTTDIEVRTQVIERLTTECGFKTFFKNKEHIGINRSNLGSETIVKWKDDEEPEDEVITSEVNKKLEELAQRLAAVPDALRSLFGN